MQVLHVDDLVSALVDAVVEDRDGVYDVAAAGWVGTDEVRALLPHGSLPAVPLEVLRRVFTRSWQAGLGEIPPSVLPYLVHPWVVATDRLEATGWRARHTNEETLLETYDSMASAAPSPAVVAGAAGAAVIGVTGGLALRRLLRRRR